MAIVDLKTARAAKRHLVADIGREPNINGIGLAPVDGGWALKVNLLTPASRAAIPRQVDGVDVKVEVVGRGMRQALA
jgi:hypothetical protein